MKFLRTVTFIAASFLLVSSWSGPARAVLIQWDVSINFDDASTAVGSFVFDNVAETFSDASITTTAGIFPARTYSVVQPFSTDAFISLLDPSDGLDFTGDPTLFFRPTTSFGDIGASFNLAVINTCFDSDCDAVIGPSTGITDNGSLNGRIIGVPEPAGLSIFILGLGLLGALMMVSGRRTRQAREPFVRGFG
ncbi:MAG: hypothetical protein GKS00_11465 [Alphaproteobacteria bacterium]|nr:hypothetical protein [Alphaproteobacteria bacterium]